MTHSSHLLAGFMIVLTGLIGQESQIAAGGHSDEPVNLLSAVYTANGSETGDEVVSDERSSTKLATDKDQAENQEPSSIEELELKRFGQLSEEGVQRECEEWVTKNGWVFGRTLAEIRLTGSGVGAKDLDALFLKGRREDASQYAKLTKDMGPIRTEGIELLETWALCRLSGADPAYLHGIGQRAKQIVAGGSSDPLMRTIAVCYATPNDNIVATTDLAKLGQELTDAGYGSFFQFTLQRHRLALATQGTEADRAAIRAKLIEATSSFVEEASGNRAATPLTWFYLGGVSNLLTEAERDVLYRNLLRRKKVDPFFLHMFVALQSNQRAWQIRGNGFADSVNDDAWRQFADLNVKASLHFRKAWLLYPNLPDAPSAMIAVANSASGSEAWSPRQWFELSCHARFDYVPAYNTYMHPLLPRWGGSREAMLDFGKECADTKVFDTPVPYFLIDFISQIAEETPDGMAWENPEYVDVLLDFWESMDEWVKQNTIVKEANHWRNQYSMKAAVLIRNGRYAEAKSVLEQTPFPPATAPMQKILGDPAFAASKAYALSEPGAMGLIDIEQRFGQTFAPITAVTEFSAAIETVTAARLANTNAKAERYFAVREDSLRKQKSFQEGAWVELGFDEPLTTWSVRNGVAIVEGPSTLRISNVAVSTLAVQAIPNATFPPPYSIKAKVERIRGNEWFEFVGISVGSVSQATMLGAPGGVAFVLGDMPRVAGSYVPGRRQVERFPVDNLSDAAEVELHIWPTTYQMIVNGQTLPLPPIQNFSPNSEFSIGGNPYEHDIGEIRISNVQIRKLVDPEPLSK